MTDFNCECADTNTSETLETYRTRMLERCGFAAIASNPPPGTASLFNGFLRDAQEYLYRMYPALRTRRLFRWRLLEGERYYGMRDNDETWTDVTVGMSAGAPGVIAFTDDPPDNGHLIQFWPGDDPLPAELTAYHKYYVVGSNPEYNSCEVALTENGEPLTLSDTVAGINASYSPADACVFNMDPYKNIEGAWLVDLNGQWLPMTCGIPPTFYTTANQPSLTLRYEIRQCIEVFPAPQSEGYAMYIKGHFGLAAFSDDDDKATIDGQLVYLWALANALDYYGKPAAKGVAQQASDTLGQLTAGTHTGKRYVPGTIPVPPAIMPVYAPWPGEY